MGRERNGSLRCYNQFAYHYASFDEMIAQLPEIAAMGFNAVWTSPLHPVTDFVKGSGETGSLYAMSDPWSWRPDFFGTGKVDGQKAKLKQYTAKARALGMTPMFDLVLKHMGVNCPLHLGNDPLLQHLGIDTRRWFANNGTVVDGVAWDDAVAFNYEDETVRNEIIRYLWKHYVKMYVEELGFDGVRIDAAHRIYADVVKEMIAFIGTLIKDFRRPIILAEMLGGVSDEQRHFLRWPHEEYHGITHATIGSFWFPNIQLCLLQGGQLHELKPWCLDKMGWVDKDKGKLHVTLRFTPDDKIRHHGEVGTVAFPDSHDHVPWTRYLMDKKGMTNPADMERVVREAIAISALYSDSGWF